LQSISHDELDEDHHAIDQSIEQTKSVDQNDIIISCSWDKSIKSWSLKSMKTLNTVEAHEDLIVSIVRLKSGLFATSASDGIKIWNPYNFKCVKFVKESTPMLRLLMEYGNDCVITGTFSDKVQIRCLNTDHICEKTICGKWVYSMIQIDECTFASGAGEGFINIWKKRYNY